VPGADVRKPDLDLFKMLVITGGIVSVLLVVGLVLLGFPPSR